MKKGPPIMHNLVPKHELLSREEKEKILSTLRASNANIPRIHSDDPGLQLFNIKANPGDLVKITRKEETGTSPYYRIVIE